MIKKDKEPILYHAFEIYTESMVHLCAHPDKSIVDVQFEKYNNLLKEDIETYILGTIRAVSWERALNAMRAGDWEEFTQYA